MVTVDRKKFINWILEDAADFHAKKELVQDKLLYSNVLTTEDLFSSCGYIPGRFIIEPGNEEDEFYPDIDCKLEKFKV
jgi:hypothetical protein